MQRRSDPRRRSAMRRLAVVVLFVVVGVVAAVAWAGGAGDSTATAGPSRQLTPLQQKLMSGFASRALERRTVVQAPRVRGMRKVGTAAVGTTSETGCPANRG